MNNRKSIVRAILDAVLIRRSGLLHVRYYRSQLFSELKADRYLLRLFPSLHYVLIGAPVSKNPNQFFDTEFYQDHHPDVSRSGQNPLAHFIRHGAREKFNPGPFFDTEYYLALDPAISDSGLNPLVHYFRIGRQLGHKPHPVMDTICRVPEPSAVVIETGREWLHQGLGVFHASDPVVAQRSDRVIRFEWDIGGWNNIRMQAEVMVCLAERYDRALVLPEPEPWYLIPGGHSHLFDFFDEAAFKAAVPVLPPETRLDDEWEVPASLAVTSTTRLKREEYLRQQHRESWYFPKTTRMFGWFASVLGSDTRDYGLIHGAFRVRADLLDKVIQLLRAHGLAPGAYLAAHVRRGDFQYDDMRYLATAKIIEALRSHGANAAGTVLIVSDEYDEELLDACRGQGWKTVCWATKDVGAANLSGILDMLACCLGWRFVGTNLSTFSHGIIQWRGYISRVAGTSVDAIPRFMMEQDQIPWWATVDEHAWLSI